MSGYSSVLAENVDARYHSQKNTGPDPWEHAQRVLRKHTDSGRLFFGVPLMATLDMTDGVYRRIYSGFLDNKKINRLSWMAEAWFWRLVVLADDYGNLSLKWRVLAVDASPIREVSTADAKRLTDEVVDSRLAFVYEVDGESYLHIVGFMEKQPAGKNGRRIQRRPMHPEHSGPIQVYAGESGTVLGNRGESGGIQNNPGESSPSETTNDTETTTDAKKIQTQPTAAGGVVCEQTPKPERKPPKLIPDFSPAFVGFWSAYPSVRRMNKQKCWKQWTADYLDRDNATAAVMEGLRRWKRCDQWNRDGGQYVCNPHRWLLNRMYAEEPPTAPIKEHRE